MYFVFNQCKTFNKLKAPTTVEQIKKAKKKFSLN